jgi:hypothetical protein
MSFSGCGAPVRLDCSQFCERVVLGVSGDPHFGAFVGCGGDTFAELPIDAPSGGNGDHFLGVRRETNTPYQGESWHLFWFDYVWRGGIDACSEGERVQLQATASARALVGYDVKSQTSVERPRTRTSR